MPILLLKLLGISAWIKKGAYAPLCGIKRYPLHAALIASLCISGWLWRGKQSAIAERDDARAETVALQTKFDRAQEQAEVKQNTADKSNLGGQLAGNKKLDDNHANLENVRRNSVTAFAARLPKATGGPPCRASAAGVHSGPGQAIEGRADSDLAIKPEQLEAISRTEMQNSERGQFLRGLVEQGLAVPASEVPTP